MEPIADAHIRREDTPAAQERRALEVKLPAALAFARAAGINRRVAATGARARLGVVAAGKAYTDLREACAQLGLLHESDLADAGLEILKLGMTWPVDDALVREFAAGVEQILVIEEKRAFVEPQVKEALYGASAVPVYGKRDATGAPLVPSTGILNVSDIAAVLVGMLGDGILRGVNAATFLSRAETGRDAALAANAPARQERTPLFCAGCPHNTSTRVPEGSRATAGIGCHYMVQWMNRDTDSCTQMGGEGVTWVGESAFTDEEHIFANLGDGTYFHSGILAIRQAVAAGVNITYKILFNDAVAMTGGQPMDGELSVADVVAQVRAEGVSEVVIVSDEPGLHDGLRREGIAVYPRGELDAVQVRLKEIPGASVLIYQQTCATELRRRRKRGLVADERPRVMINEAVCDGCGDCTVQSNCVAVEPKETAFGIKRHINQTTCNKDLSCATGFCPAFVEVEGEIRRGAGAAHDLEAIKARLPTPELKPTADVLITGVGGTGIVTLSAMLAAAAKIDGRPVRTLDMTGLAQKGGAVFSHVRIGDAGAETLHTARIPDGAADVVVGCDLVSAAASETLELVSDHTLAVLNTHVTPTAEFVLSQSHDAQLRRRLRRLKKVVGGLKTLAAEDVVEHALGDAQQANVLLLGFAYQSGCIPLSLTAIEAAIRINGVAVERNILAFHLGRAQAVPAAAAETTVAATNPTRGGVETSESEMTLEALISHRSDHLRAYQGRLGGERLVARYRTLVDAVAAKEAEVRAGSERLTRAVAISYAKLLAAKDEYEVARLHAAPAFKQALEGQFGPGAKISYLLAPPALGPSKRRFGAWMGVSFKLLAAIRSLRNTPLDPFAYSHDRRRELELIEHFEGVVAQLIDGLTLSNLRQAVAIASLPQDMRGYGHVKAAKVANALAREKALMQEFTTPPEPVNLFDPSVKAGDREAA